VKVFSSLVELFLWRVEKSRSHPALWFKKDGRFHSISWNEFRDRVKAVALALHGLAARKGDRIGILSENRPEWAFADLGILSLGAASVPIYPTTTPKECRYILEHSEVSTLFVSTLQQLDKVRPLIEEGKLSWVICFDPEVGTEGKTLSFEDLLEKGRRCNLNNSNLYSQLVSKVQGDELATIIYTSGTTGPPKGVMLTHNNFISNCQAAAEALPLKEGERALSFLPLSHVFERMAGYYFMIQAGASIAYAESMQSVPEDLLLVRPTVAASVPRLFEKMHARIMETVQAGSPTKQKIFKWAHDVGKVVGKLRQEKKNLPLALKIQFGLARMLVFNRLKQRLGGSIRFFISGGAPLSKELGEFFFSAGVLILEGYGLTETSPVISVNRLEGFKFGTVGLPLGNVEVKIASDGEILSRGPHIMKGYFKNEDATREAIRDGWFYTGDIGEIDSEGFLKITDRKKDLIITAGGKNISPQNIELEVLKDPFFSQIVAIGDRRPYLVALVVPNRALVERFAASQEIRGDSWEELLKDSRVVEALAKRIQERLKDFASYEQIKHFQLLPKELTLDGGELTPTLKVKRRVVMERFASLIDALYEQGKTHASTRNCSEFV